MPSVFQELMGQCWNAHKKDPIFIHIHTLWEKVENINKSLHENSDYWKKVNIHIDSNLLPGLSAIVRFMLFKIKKMPPKVIYTYYTIITVLRHY